MTAGLRQALHDRACGSHRIASVLQFGLKEGGDVWIILDQKDGKSRHALSKRSGSPPGDSHLESILKGSAPCRRVLSCNLQAGRPSQFEWVLVRDPKGIFPTQALLCTGLLESPVQILEDFVQRWQLEATFEVIRAHLEVETQRQ